MTAPSERRSTGRVRGALRRARLGATELPESRVNLGLAVLIGAVAAGLSIVAKALLNSTIGGDSGFIVLTAGAVAATWLGGIRSGIIAAVAIALINLLIFVAPVAGSSPTAFSLESIDLIRAALFTLAASVVVYVVGSLRSARDRLAVSLDRVATMAADIERRDERLELVLAASGTGFWEWDIATGDLVWSNAIFEQHGLDPLGSAPTYAGYLETIHPDDRPAFAQSIQDALDHGSSFATEFRILWPDGSVHWTHGVGRVFRNAAGMPVRMVGTGQDITARRALEAERDQLLEEERRAGAIRESFVEVISHELRTPITTILGLTQILIRPGRTAVGTDTDGLIQDIAAESERLHRLVEDLVVLSRAERGRIGVESEPLEPRRLLQRIVEREAPRLPGLRISTDLPPDLPIVSGEASYVEQIVRNILGNAAKYTPPGTAVVVRATAEADGVAIRVIDDGPGIDPETAARAFELFYRDPVKARSVAGSGIGLFVCASLVDAMGGTIWAMPRPGGGSEFGFTLRGIPDDDVDRPDDIEPTAAAANVGVGVASGVAPD